MKMLRHSLLQFLLFLSPLYLFAQVKLTEVAPTNTGQITDSDNERPDWIEIRNTAASSSDMSGRTWLHVGLAAANPIYGPTPTWFNPGAPTGGELHADFKLSYSEKLTLYNPAGNIVDSVSIGYLQPGHFGADPDSVNMVKTHFGLGNYLPEYGTIDDFFAMSDFIENNDMSDPANFEKASQLLDIQNFTDYFETEIYVASTDWLQDYFNNLRLFKTKKDAPWKFLLWDVSYSSGNPLAGSTCTSCDVLSSTLSHDSRYGRMLRSLLDNPEYRQYFLYG